MDRTETLNTHPCRWEGKFVVLGVTGSIAAYKSAELVRRIQDQGAEVQVVMTKTATRLMSPETLKYLSGRKVLTELMEDDQSWTIGHISLADKADAYLVAPATANIIAKMAYGLADDLLSSTLLASKKPLIVAPAMNDNMYSHPATQENLETLHRRGTIIVSPGEGYLACGKIGTGRLADIPDILGALDYVLHPDKSLAGKKVLVSAGPTREAIDPVRYLSNHSSGKMGYAIAEAAYNLGANVTLVSGPVSLRPPYGVHTVPVISAAEMAEALLDRFDDSDIVVMAAAVADYRPSESSAHKIKKTDQPQDIPLTPTLDILKEMGQRKSRQVLVGFAAETDNLLQYAQSKIDAKNLDFMVANDVSQPGIGFGSDKNTVTFITKSGVLETWGPAPKWAVAERLFHHLNILG